MSGAGQPTTNDLGLGIIASRNLSVGTLRVDSMTTAPALGTKSFAGGASVALSPEVPVNLLTTADSGDVYTLADGDEGALVRIVLATRDGAGNVLVTPANLANGTSIQFAAATVGESAELVFASGSWWVLNLGDPAAAGNVSVV